MTDRDAWLDSNEWIADGPMKYHADSWFKLTEMEIDEMHVEEGTEHAHLISKARGAVPTLQEETGQFIKPILDDHRNANSEEYARAAGLKGSATLEKYWNGKLVAAEFEFGRKLHHDRPVKGNVYRERGAEVDQAISQMMMVFQSIDAGTREFVTLSRQIKVLDVLAGLLDSESFSCSKCHSRTNDPSLLYLFITCGHILCGKCESEFDRTEQIQCPIKGCDCVIKSALFACSSLFQGGMEIPQSLETASGKVRKIVDTIEIQVPEDEKVLLFVTTPVLKTQLGNELRRRKIGLYETKGGERDAEVITGFKEHPGRAVLLQTLMSSESAGTNLTEANHIMFAAPLHTDTQNYYMYERQARGRAVRFGQKRDVTVYHFLTAYTIEVDILQHRFRQQLRVKQGSDHVVIDTKSRDEWSKQLLFGSTFTVREHRDRRDPIMVSPFDIGQVVPSAATATAADMKNGIATKPPGDSTLTKLQRWLTELATVNDEHGSVTDPESPTEGAANREKKTSRNYQADIGAFVAPEHIRKLLCFGDLEEWQDELVVDSTAQ